MTESECYFIENKKCEKNGECIHRLHYYKNDCSNYEYWKEKEE